MLLHKLKWEQNQTFTSIFQKNIRYLHEHYGTNVKVVFDGTKASERNRRCYIIDNASIDYRFDMVLKTTKEKFLTNSKNKNRFINLLYSKLVENNFECSRA